MRPRDLGLYARTRLQLLRALDDVRARADRAGEERVQQQLHSHPYNHAAVIAECDRLQRPTTPVAEPLSVIDRVRGKAVHSPNPKGGG